MIKVQLTTDGTHTLYVPEIDEHYHSTNGAAQESRHIFINCGLRYLDKSKVRILEVGFGTGLNALLTLQESFLREGLSVEYHAVELYPLDTRLASRLNYGELLGGDYPRWFSTLHNAPWDTPVALTPSYTLYKIAGDIASVLLPAGIDLVYFDAFAPAKQPEMWTPEIFRRIACNMVAGGVLVTYCAKGEVRRRLQSAGFRMEKLPGPPGKRHILRGTKEGQS